MAKKNKKVMELPTQPDELKELSIKVAEFIKRMRTIESEIELLKLDKTELVEQYKQELDIKTLKEALKIIKIKNAVEHKHTFDVFMEILDGKVGVDDQA